MEIKSIHNSGLMVSEERREKMILALACMMHENWRKNRFDSKTNSYIPRMKKVRDCNWIKEHEGMVEIDIASMPFEDLPDDWREENILSAKIAIEKMEDILNLIHDNWLDRNDSTAFEKQKVQYSKLPNEEKIKDADILKEAIEIYLKFNKKS